MLVSGKANSMGVRFSIRASRAIRVLLNKEGEAWRIIDITRRGDKTMYSGEG